MTTNDKMAAVFDTETTGVETSTARIIEICIRNLQDPDDRLVLRINPGVEIPPDSTKCHGITDDDVAGCPRFGEVADEVLKFLERFHVLIGYNPDFDLRITQMELGRAGLSWPGPPVLVCCLKLWNRIEPKPERHLQAAYKRWVSVDGFEGAHGAAADVNATAKVFFAQLHHFEGLPWEDLESNPKRFRQVGGSNHFMWNEERTDIVCTFGKFKGQSIRVIDAGYFRYIQDKDFPLGVKTLAREVAELFRQKLSDDERHRRILTWAQNQENQ